MNVFIFNKDTTKVNVHFLGQNKPRKLVVVYYQV